MSRLLAVQIALEAARVTAPSFAEALAGRLTPQRVDERVVAFARRVIARAGIELDVRGVGQVPTDRAFVYMSNHQSHTDIPVLYATAPARRLRMVAKSELFAIPGFGQAMRSGGFIEVDRRDRAQAIASLGRAAEQLRAGTSIWIAPEGTRSKTGALGPLKKGGFHLARDAETPILPVAISGTHAVLPPGSIDMAPGQTVRVVYGAPIPVAGREIDELQAEVAAFLRDNVDPAMRRAGR